MFEGEDGIDKGVLAYISGAGFMSIGGFFVFFMWGSEYSKIYPMVFISIILSSLVVFFYLLDDLNFMYNHALNADDPEETKTKIKRGSNFISGNLLFLISILNIYTYREYTVDLSLRVLIITLLTLFSVFLLLYSMFMAD